MNTINWTRTDCIALILIPMQFLITWTIVFMQMEHMQNMVLTIIFVLGLLSVCILSKIYGTTLKNDWAEYRKKIKFNILISILGIPSMIIILYVVRLLMSQFLPVASNQVADENEVILIPFAITLIIAIMPLINAFQEEIIFRHVLFYKFREVRHLSVIFFFVSAFLFGSAHLNNFDGNFIATIPYMVIAMFFNLVYLFTKNIWYSIGMHLAFNFIMGFLPTLFVHVMQNFIV